jgi:hypothetical protein
MKPTITSWNGHNINDYNPGAGSGNYKAAFPDNSFFPQGKSQSIELTRSDMPPVISSTKHQSKVMQIDIYPKGVFTIQVNQIHGWFDTFDRNLHALVITDENAVQWYVNAKVEEEPHVYVDYIRITLRVPDPVWKTVIPASTSWAITATGQTKQITTIGNRSVFPQITLTPTVAKTGGFGYYEFRAWRNPQAVQLKDEVIDVAAAAWNTSTLVGAGKALASGADFRLFVNGNAQPFWLSGWNGANTKVWTTLDFDPGIALTLSGAIDNHSAVTTITFQNTTANQDALKNLILKKYLFLVIGSEIFVPNSVDLQNLKVTTTGSDMRAGFGSTKAAHSDGDSVYWIQYIFELCYGNATLTAPTMDDTKKPVLNMTSSTNTSWVWDTNFSDATGVRGATWKPATLVSPGKASQPYTATHLALADPSTVMGMIIAAYLQSTWRGENATVIWQLYNAAGFTTATVVDAVYRYGVATDWPAIMGMQKSLDGINWSSVFNEAAPASIKTWTAGAAHSGVALGATYPFLRMIASGGIASGIASDYAAIEATSITLARDSSKVPQLSYTSASIGGNEFAFKITNVGTGDSISLAFTLGVNESILIDCQNKEVIYLTNNASINGALTPNSKRNYWLTIEPPITAGGITNGDTLRFDDVGTNGVTATIAYADRIA